MLLLHMRHMADFHISKECPLGWPLDVPGAALVGGPAAIVRIKKVMGANWMFNPQNPTGRYQLDMENFFDRLLMLRLMEVSSEENAERQKLSQADLSQLGNWECFRNVRFNHKDGDVQSDATVLPLQSNATVLPPSGLFIFDFQSFRRPYTCAQA